MRITVVGTSYLGTSHAVGMAEFGFEVLGYDIDDAKVDLLSGGRAPFYEPGIDAALATHTGSGRLRFTSSADEAAEFGEVVFFGVGTPQRDSEGTADLRQVRAAVRDIVSRLRGDTLVVLKSTVPVGTSLELLDLIDEYTPAGVEIDYAFNPEFLREGNSLHDTLHPDRLILGLHRTGDAPNAHAEKLLREIYRRPIDEGTPVIVTDFATSELVKMAANSFLVTKISFINAMADLCDAAGADVTVLADAIGIDERIGRRFLDAGIGYGGGCLPKDVRAFMARAGELGVGEALSFLREVDAINTHRRVRAVELAGELLGGSVAGRRVAVLGAAFKPESNDVRDSPALAVAGELHLHGAQVVVYDPEAVANARSHWPTLGYADSTGEACTGAELVVLGTHWPEFRDLDPDRLRDVVARPVMLDGRNVLDPATWRAAGWTYRGIGRP